MDLFVGDISSRSNHKLCWNGMTYKYPFPQLPPEITKQGWEMWKDVLVYYTYK